MEQQNTNFQALIYSLSVDKLRSLILLMSEEDSLLSDRIIGMIRHLSSDTGIPNTSQWDPKEISAQAHRILHPPSKCWNDRFEMEAAGDSYNNFLLSLQNMFLASPTTQIIQVLKGVTEPIARNLDRIMDNCDEGLPWQDVAEQLGAYWLQIISYKDLSDADHRSLLSLLSNWIPQFADYALDPPFYPIIKTLQERISTRQSFNH